MPSPLDAARLSRADALLAALAALGLAVVLWGLPRIHPDTAVDFSLTREGAIAEAEEVLHAAGFETDGLTATALLRPVSSLLDSLQPALGRARLTDALRAEPGRLPAFRWRVRFESGPQSVDPRKRTAFEVGLGPDGRLWHLTNGENALPATSGDRQDLAQRLYASAETPPFRIPDAVADDPLTFDVEDDDLGAGWTDRLVREARALSVPGAQTVGPAVAGALAREHLRKTAMAAFDLQPVRVERVAGRGDYAARVWLAAPERVWGQRVGASVDVTAGGDLLAIETHFNEDSLQAQAPSPDSETAGGNMSVTYQSGSSGIAPFDVLAIVSWVVLGGGFVVVFVRRLMAQALDLRAALTDAAAAAVAVSLYPFLLLPMMRELLGLDGYTLVVAIVAGVLFWVAAAGLMTFITSAVSDSLMRARRREKLDALALVRQGRVLNRVVGASLVRASLGATALMGLAVALLALLPVRLDYSGDNGWGVFQMALSPGAIVTTQAFWFQFAVGLAVLVGVGAVLMGAARRWVPAEGPARAAVVVLGLAVCSGVLRLGPGGLESDPGGVVFLYGACYGAALGGLLWRFDALTALVSFFLVEAAWALTPTLWAAATPFALDAVGVLALVPLLGFVGAMGMRRVPRRADLRRYVPSYITELATRERLQREVEIAREVQRSFLPATMPDVDGLDLAAVCLPAEEVGGDYYDAFPIPSPGGGPARLAVVVGDVSGKGIQAAFYMTLVKGIVRTLGPSGLGPAGVLTRLNEVFAENAQPGAFVSAIYGVIDPAARTFTYARAGHNPLLVRRRRTADGDAADVEARRPSGLAVGLTSGPAFGHTLAEDTVHLSPGDALVLYTDGFSEAMDAARDLYTDRRLARLFAESTDTAAAALVGHAVADVRAFASADANPDDMTMLVVKVTGGSEDQGV